MSIVQPMDCPFYLISRVTLQITSVLKKELTEAGAMDVKPAYLGALLCLWSEDGQKVIDIARCARLEPSTMTGLMDRMERDDLLQRRADPNDRRAQIIWLTEKGKAAETPCRKVIDDVFARIFNDIADEEIDRTMGTLKQVLAAFEKDKKNK